jgi:hypothetical protein
MHELHRVLTALAGLAALGTAHADIVSEWADRTTEIATDGPNTVRTIALAQSAVYEAVNAITGRYPADLVPLGKTEGASMDAAVAAASHLILVHEAPDLKATADAVYERALARLPDDDARRTGTLVGERAAVDVLGKHREDMGNPEPYRPYATPGIYVPTSNVLGYASSQHHPWFLKSADSIRPGPPPALKSAEWTHDYNETKDLGAVNSSKRTPEQTKVALFWASALPEIHIGVVRSVAITQGRDLTRNARLYAAVTGAMNDAEISVFEAKYHYNFWRPVTATRNGDMDGNDATERDGGWMSLIATPLQPEYPCGHCILASVVANIIRIENGSDPLPPLSTLSNTAPGVTRYWTNPDDLINEVANARIWAGVHYRASANAGIRMGEQVAKAVAEAYHLP